MGDPYGLVTWPGMVAFKSASITLIHGITPSVAQIVMQPQNGNVDIDGTMTFEYDDMTKTFINCHADYGSFRWDESGAVWEIAIFDRRWWWRFGWVAGEYNIVRPDAKLKMDTEKAPQDLAKLCLEAMGEDEWDVGDLPNDSRPYINWDYENPASALADLCDLLGCYIVPEFDSSTGKICKSGQGGFLPDGGVLQSSATIDNPETPTALMILFGPTLFQYDFLLEAVCEENDDKGTIKTLSDKTLTYTPSNGWAKEDPDSFSNVLKEKGAVAAEKARRSVWRWYRVKIPTDGINVAGYSNTIKSRDCVLLKRTQVRNTQDEDAVGDDANRIREKPAIIYGIWWHRAKDANKMKNVADTVDSSVSDNDKSRIHHVRFTVDEKNRLVKFDEPIFAFSGTDRVEADIRLRTGCNLLDPDTRAMVRDSKKKSTGAGGNDVDDCETRIISHPEMIVRRTPDFPDGVNVDGLNTEADYYLAAALKEYDTKTPIVGTYIGLLDVDMDGAIQQVSYSIHEGGCDTVIARDTEELHRVQPYRHAAAAGKAAGGCGQGSRRGGTNQTH